MKLINLDDLKTMNLNILAYGEPGCGKTHFVGTTGECLYTLAFDVDNGFKTLRQLPKSMTGNIVPILMDSFKDLDDIYKMVQKNDPVAWSKYLGKEITKPFEAIAIDTWSELNWDIQQEKRKAIGKLGTGLTFRDNIQIQDWGAISDLNKLSIQAFTDAPITFICTMHEQFYTDEKSGITKGLPIIMGKLAGEVGKYFDIVGHMYSDMSGKYCMDTVSKKKYQAKSRLKLDATIFDPTFIKLWQAISGQ